MSDEQAARIRELEAENAELNKALGTIANPLWELHIKVDKLQSWVSFTTGKLDTLLSKEWAGDMARAMLEEPLPERYSEQYITAQLPIEQTTQALERGYQPPRDDAGLARLLDVPLPSKSEAEQIDLATGQHPTQQPPAFNLDPSVNPQVKN